MAIAAGTKLGPYEVLSRLGAGGMGEVYRARDPKLNRELAIKVLPIALSNDRDFLARFQAEARAASALNHPNIITIHDLGEVDGHSYILMELVDGKTVRELMEPGALPLKKTLQLAAQAAEGLAAAHARGIVHRDLKPENLMVTKDGVLKILDFGLAKTASFGGSAEDQTVSAGITGTEPGTVLGTVGYMSPEQASGQQVDFRGDQFSLGTILYEMITGKRAWRRKTPAESLVAIIREEPPPMAAAAPDTPTALRWIVERCLAKDPEDRYAATKDLARDLRALSEHFSDLTSGSSVGVRAPAAARTRLGPPALALAAAALLIGAGAAWFLRPKPAPWSPPSPHYLTYSGRDSDPAVSPDGKVLAFTSERSGRKRIWLKQLSDGSEAVLTSGPDRAPRFSPDGSTVFFTRREADFDAVYRIAAVGGEPRKVVDNASDADVSPDGKQIAFLRPRKNGKDSGGLLLVVPIAGGAERELASFELLVAAPPRWSPDGRFITLPHSLTGALGGVPWQISIVPLAGGPARALSPAGATGLVSTAIWTGDGRGIIYMQSDPGYFSTSGRIVLQDVSSGAPRMLLRALNLGFTLDSVGPNSLVYQANSIRANLREQTFTTSPDFATRADTRWLTRGYGVDRQPFYSPDGQRVVFTSNRDGNMDIWELTPATGAVRRLTDDPADDWDPFLTKDGKHLLWSSNRTGNYEIWIANPDGTSPRQLSHDKEAAQRAGAPSPGDAENPTVTPDGQLVVYGAYGAATAGIWVMRIDGSEPRQITAGTFRDPNLSPDGKYIATISLGGDQKLIILEFSSGKPLAFSRPLIMNPATGQATGRLRFSPDGRFLLFSGADDLGTTGVFVQDFEPDRDTSRTIRKVAGFDADYFVDGFAVSPDGRRIILAPTEQPSDLVRVDGLAGLPSPPRRAAQ